MRTVDKRITIDRRKFLGGTAGAALLAGVVGETNGSRALAATMKTVNTPEMAAALVRMARDIFPHDRVPDVYYETAIATIDGSLGADAASCSLLPDGVAALDAAAKARFNAAYVAVPLEADRVTLLRAIEATPFFAKVRGGLVTALYNQPEIWKLLGYEGSSADHGGYIHRGFDDIDWPPA